MEEESFLCFFLLRKISPGVLSFRAFFIARESMLFYALQLGLQRGTPFNGLRQCQHAKHTVHTEHGAWSMKYTEHTVHSEHTVHTELPEVPEHMEHPFRGTARFPCMKRVAQTHLHAIRALIKLPCETNRKQR